MSVKIRIVLLIAVFMLAAARLYCVRKETTPSPPVAVQVRAVENSSTAPSVSAAEPPPVVVRPESPTPPPQSEESRAASRRDFENPLVSSYPDTTPAPRRAADYEPEIAAQFDKISLMLRDYRTLASENPTGTNAEIMKAIMGGNPKGARLGPPEGLSLNENGELLDHWGTPYFFHQLTRDLMEIRSAGPDRRMWNEDDLTGD